MSNAAQLRLEAAIPAALERITATPGVYAVLWCGSASRGEGNEFSDLDFHALMQGDHRWRSSFVVEGVPVEVFHNPPRKVRAMFAENDAATIAMFASGKVLVPHPDLTDLQQDAQARYAAGPPVRMPTPFERFMLVDTVMDARAALHDPIHVALVMAALGPLVIRPLYAQNGWWDVKPQHWLSDLANRAPDLAAELRQVLEATQANARQAALEALALRLTADFEYRDFESERQVVPPA